MTSGLFLMSLDTSAASVATSVDSAIRKVNVPPPTSGSANLWDGVRNCTGVEHAPIV